MGFARLLKRKPDLPRLFLKSIYKSTGCVFKRKTMVPLGAKLSNSGSLLVSRVQLLQGGVSECRNKSLQMAEDSPQSSPHLAPDSPHLADSSPHLTTELLSLAEPARLKAKLPAAEMQALALSLCDARWLASSGGLDFSR